MLLLLGAVRLLHLLSVPDCIPPALLAAVSRYDVFMRTNPSLEAFEGELRKFMAIETEIMAIPAVHNIGAQGCTRCLARCRLCELRAR
jgi:hypothetical protein